MSSNITTIYDQLSSKLAAVLTNYKQLANPYETMENPSIIATKAFGIAFGGGTNSNRLTGCQLSITREMTIPLINIVSSLEMDNTKLASTEKSLLEDALLVIRFLESQEFLNASVSRLAYISDTGIAYNDTGRGFFVVTEITAEVEYFENINI